ncbi:exopolyphosphatase [Salipaludibacillus keqinensis]|uniref:exopolyphosphatase n=1 Tax=Salipaludibacillus keqinensis TaxID=2045207 RepID=A0A323THG0_9BACI|nr:exopolyphosphatase [Salipaludibacillus keqinensis]PYZ94278.1 exopolyphosphatase [Salipaludibacillus keqinensis]
MEAQQIAIIDMGSNSIRFVIYDVNEHACFKEIQNLKVVARLSTYISDEGKMTREGIEVILSTLRKFETVMNDYLITEIRGVATAAIRNATNQVEILEAIQKESCFDITVLNEEEEAYYGYLAITNSTNISEGVTIDIGGGSTEVTFYENRILKHSHSFPFGAITLKKRFVKNDNPTKQEWKNLRQFLKDQFVSLPWLKEKNVPVIGIGGTARNIALVHQNHISYPLSGLHQYEMSGIAVSTILEKLASVSLARREKIDGLSKDRADIIVPAVAAIEELIQEVGTNQFIVSNKGLRDGLFYEMFLKSIEVTHFPHVTHESFYQLAENFGLNQEHQKKISVLSSFLAQELIHCNEIELTKADLKQLHWGANVFYIGHAIHPESQSQHSFYLLTNQSIDGLSHMDRLAIAFLSSFKSRSQLKQYASPFRHWITKEELKKYELLGAILKLCYGLDASNRNVVTEIKISKCLKKSLEISVLYNGEPYFESFHATKYKKHLERALKKEITLSFIKDQP